MVGLYSPYKWNIKECTRALMQQRHKRAIESPVAVCGQLHNDVHNVLYTGTNDLASWFQCRKIFHPQSVSSIANDDEAKCD